jgi:hypothetical protein
MYYIYFLLYFSFLSEFTPYELRPDYKNSDMFRNFPQYAMIESF